MSDRTKNLLYENTKHCKRIYLTITRGKGFLRVGLHEVDYDPREPEWEKFMLFKSWSPTIGDMPCKRATQAAYERAITLFYDQINTMLQDRVRALEGLSAEGTSPVVQ